VVVARAAAVEPEWPQVHRNGKGFETYASPL
jgi:hypothetical protein